MRYTSSGLATNKAATYAPRPRDEAEARKWAEHAYDNGYNPLAWHLGEEADPDSRQQYRWLGSYDSSRHYPGPDGVLRRHTAATREAAELRDMKIGLNAGRSFASVFNGEPDPAHPHGVRRNFERLIPLVEKSGTALGREAVNDNRQAPYLLANDNVENDNQAYPDRWVKVADAQVDDWCRKKATECRQNCADTVLPTTDFGFQFYNCYNKCMQKWGCL